jgi:hypothetical protein
MDLARMASSLNKAGTAPVHFLRDYAPILEFFIAKKVDMKSAHDSRTLISSKDERTITLLMDCGCGLFNTYGEE